MAAEDETSDKVTASLLSSRHLCALCVCVFQKLKHTESDKLQVQIQAYLDNVFDVGALLEDAETKNAALERVEELEENMSHVSALYSWISLGLVSLLSLHINVQHVDGTES